MRLNDHPSTKTDWSLPKSGIQGLHQLHTFRNWQGRGGLMAGSRKLIQPDLILNEHGAKSSRKLRVFL